MFETGEVVPRVGSILWWNRDSGLFMFVTNISPQGGIYVKYFDKSTTRNPLFTYMEEVTKDIFMIAH